LATVLSLTSMPKTSLPLTNMLLTCFPMTSMPLTCLLLTCFPRQWTWCHWHARPASVPPKRGTCHCHGVQGPNKINNLAYIERSLPSNDELWWDLKKPIRNKRTSRSTRAPAAPASYGQLVHQQHLPRMGHWM
jgi:hypothetical protein